MRSGLGLKSAGTSGAPTEELIDRRNQAGALHTIGSELVDELDQYEDSYRLSYVRSPEGIIVALAEQLS